MSEESLPIGTLVRLIFLLVVLVIVVLGLVFFNIPGKIADLFPSFEKGNVSVNWDEEVFLEHPELIFYQSNDGKSSGDIRGIGDFKFKYEKDKGWIWGTLTGNPFFGKRQQVWIIVENQEFYLYKEMGQEDREFIKGLIGKSPEEGLILLAERTLNGVCPVVGYKASLMVYIGAWSNSYNCKDNRLKNIDDIIDKFNQISRGFVKQKEFENER